MGKEEVTLEEAARAAKIVERKTGFPAEVLVAQWALESGWGEHAPGNNCFGIKDYPGCWRSQMLETKEWFTPAQLQAFLALGKGRTAKPTGQVNGDRAEYAVRDWFAMFPTLEACFEKRSRLALGKAYRAAFDLYLAEGDLEQFVRSISRVYGTSPVYADRLLRIMRQRNVTAALAVPLTQAVA